MPKVIAMQRGRKGVSGASQNAQHAEPIPKNQALFVIKYSKYITQTSLDKTKNTIINIIMFILSFKELNSLAK